jgi:hypothetical protein
MQRNTQMSLRKPEGHSKGTAAVNERDVDDFRQVHAEPVAGFEFSESQKKYLMYTKQDSL